jgi:hypothetical protein
MNNFTTVFIFNKNNPLVPELYVYLIATILLIGVGIWMIFIFISAKKKKTETINDRTYEYLVGGIFLTGIGLIWSLVNLYSCVYYTQRQIRLTRIYESKQYQIAEGTVHVISIEPKEEHAPGDKIQVDGVEFEIVNNLLDFGYNTSITHGGVLTEGVFAKIFYYDGTILRIDLRQ